ncbi:CPBP family intramembrane glutamic endopeptidase [Stomatobaculum longum]|uniref:CPBP family intramembrane glutamic endopeptidase n=1 Tax=Stomatobaculum longum TaxID=796942 RepID=UPI0028EEE36F|nr:CPBP family intramembrane glutamic endopeptidase [Stomatobaculum longum]
MTSKERAVSGLRLLLVASLIYSYSYIDAILALLAEGGLAFLGVSWDYLDANQNLGYVCSALVLCLVYSGLLKFVKRNYEERPATLKLRPISGTLQMLLIGLGVGGVSLLWLNFAELIQKSIPALQASYETFNTEMGAFENGDYIWMLLEVSIIGPMVEELLFRGLVFHFVERDTGKEGAAIFISALLFGIWHGIFVQGVYTFLIGLVLGYLYAKTRKLIWPFLVHLVNNFSGTLPPGFDGEFANLLVNLASLICIPVLFILLWRMEKNTKQIEKTLP